MTERSTQPPAASESPVESPPSRDSEEGMVAADVSARIENGTENGSINVWPDEAAEASFMAEARERGEPVTTAIPARAKAEEEAEVGTKNLPPLDDLMNRLSPEVKETLEDLFRAKFTSVRRIPAKLLKT